MPSNIVSCNLASPLACVRIRRNPAKSISAGFSNGVEKLNYSAGCCRRAVTAEVTNKNISCVASLSFRKNSRKEIHRVGCKLSDSNVPEAVNVEITGEETQTVEKKDWTTSILLFVFYGALMYYVFILPPNQTPASDLYFLQKLLNLKGDDGFRMNGVLVPLWYIMGLWPVLYSMLLIPTARSTGIKIPVWPFCVLSFVGGSFILLPYFILWSPPPPPIDESELQKWPLNILESKLTAIFLFTGGLVLVAASLLAGGTDWQEFYQYFRSSKFIHLMSLDFCLLSAFASFWVYNDMSARKWLEKGSWLLPVSVVPFLGPALYLVLRPSLSSLPQSEQE